MRVPGCDSGVKGQLKEVVGGRLKLVTEETRERVSSRVREEDMSSVVASRVVEGMEPQAVTCMACRVRVNAPDQREHYRSEWHRVNLKRRVAGVGPIDYEGFEQRMEDLKDVARKEAGMKDKKDKKAFICDACSKRFSSEKALEQHERSRRHLDKVSELNGGLNDDEDNEEDQDLEDAQVEYDRRMAEAVPLSPTECLFSRHQSASIVENMRYMAKYHSFFLPYVDSIRDVEALLTYLGEKVGVGYACVNCSKSFSSLESVRKHMVDKSHCKMIEDEDAWYDEYGEFYEWEEDATEDEGDAEWEELEGEDAEQALITHEHAVSSTALGSSRRDLMPRQDDSAYELILQSGMRVGHRSMLRYYKQNPRAIETRDSVLLNKIVRDYRLLGNGRSGAQRQILPSRKDLEARRRVEMQVSKRNYYINKTKTNTNLTVLNSGYRP